MINSSRHPNLELKKDQTAKQSLLPTNWSLQPFRETSKKISNRKHHSKLHPKKKNLHQLERLWPSQTRKDLLEKGPSEQKQIRCRTTRNSPGFTTSTTPGKLRKPSFTKHRKPSMNAAPLWPKKRRNLTTCSKKSTPIEK